MAPVKAPLTCPKSSESIVPSPKNEEKKQEDKEKEEEEIKLSWPPLESDPKIFNDYFHSIGMKTDVYFKELISLVDISAFYSITGPLLGLILNYSREERTKEQKEQECFKK